MNELKPEDVMNILDRMDFFQGQRAGRELWHDKPFEVQEQDIADFTKGIAAVKAFIKVAIALLREKDAEIERLTAYNANLLCANTDITNRHKDYVEEAERIARADAITEFVERLKDIVYGECLINGHKYYVINAISIDQIAKEMKGDEDGKG